MNGPQAAMLPDGRRLHLHHGPIDLIAEAFGSPSECRIALEQAARRFDSVLEELVEELPLLRRPPAENDGPIGPTARRMAEAVEPHPGVFVTPMAAVAGAVADDVLAAMTSGRRLARAYVNNGGDAALYANVGRSFSVAIASGTSGPVGHVRVRAEDGVGGVATSGWRGRSLSLGIADAVTVLASSAAAADAAATLIANAVDLPGSAKIRRGPANAEDPDSDLGSRLVTLDVAPLDEHEIAAALDRGRETAEDMLLKGTIVSAALFLSGSSRVAGELSAPQLRRPSAAAGCLDLVTHAPTASNMTVPRCEPG